jgi:hypothetical protein
VTRVQLVWILGLAAVPFGGCGPDPKPREGCDGPSFNLVVRAEGGPLPDDTRLTVRYGSNQDGEPYELGQAATPQAVFCEEDTSPGGAASEPEPAGAGAGAGGAPTLPPAVTTGVHALRCRLYTQGPARVDITATGYQPIEDEPLSFDGKNRCEVGVEIELEPFVPDLDP